ncbi:MAG: mechanosensitive ion channel [Corynebacterium sp.]|uniref:mechanosensitive ion channel domain-containing protein n=2 Tax=Corynebacterium sp. TaxID=1720 RepID=UPI0026473790|nr:mechanosensitive ion channel domain-containing protein [Corynebacterium sp.]MDN6283541.1 mechanosensitive ion channel [Corynebacterium sp.]MDN6305529.1 mechanosensitive ion channel [Corynebacterium sp.]MDN6353682.1 mechanosensitive ion channel [Corynebacterium sp.]MDN6367749.1 mechanosensitive ion channel [Corynebacterium sp.]MDN6376564.1 mechanosensitive ion channel [Corynebacterium sp.]
MDFSYFLFRVWEWVIAHGLPLSALLIIGILIPRLGRQATRWVSQRFEEDEESGKASLALVGALVYILEIVAYFILILVALSNLGVPPLGAAVPATVVSAAVGFGAQNIIGDFLNGFFIISERHYGVGDIITFDDTGDALMGTVVKLTLRTTQIRTFNGELVTVPNSKATVTINYSKQWARAVVQLDLPLTKGESMTDLVDKVSESAHQAVDAAGVADDIRGEITLLPARSITAPTAAGLPWTVGMEINVATSPALQWAVERAIRTNIINTFWDRYQAPGETSSVLEAGLPLAGAVSARAAAQESARESAPESGQKPDDTSAFDASSDTQKLVNAATAGGDPHTDQTEELDGAESTDTSTDETVVMSATTGGAEATAAASDGDSDADSGTDDDTHHENHPNGTALDGPYDSKTKNVLSLGGRFRPSTLALFLALAVVGLLALFSTNPEDGSAGWLSPDRYRSTGDTTSVTEETSTPTEEAPVEQETTDPVDEGTTDEGTDSPAGQQDGANTDSDSGSTGSDDSGNSGNSGNTGDTASGAAGANGTGNTGDSGDGATDGPQALTVS